MLVKFCDFSYQKPNWKQLYALGYRVVAGYLSNTPGKGMTAQDIKDCLAAGLYFVALYETSANAALGGRATGVAQATAATAIARQVGYTGKLIIYAIDFDATTTQMATVAKFVEGLHDVSGLDGEYGGIDQLRYLLTHGGDTGRMFQTYAWSHGQWLPLTQAPIRQELNGQLVAGGDVDKGEIDDSILPLIMAPTNGAGDVPIGGTEPVTPADAQLFVDTLLQPANAGKLWDILFNGAAGDKIPFGDQPQTQTNTDFTSAARHALWQIRRGVNLGTQDEMALAKKLAAHDAALAAVLNALAALPAAVVAALPPAQTGTTDPAVVKQAVIDGIESLTWKASE